MDSSKEAKDVKRLVPVGCEVCMLHDKQTKVCLVWKAVNCRVLAKRDSLAGCFRIQFL